MGKTSKPMILVVDDEQHIRDFLQEVLTAEGYEVLTADNGAGALTIAEKKQPALILLDIKMPDMDGLETCKRLRQNSATRHIRVIMLTAYDTRDRLEESIIAGADDFLGKPIHLTELNIRIQSMLKVRNMEDEVERLEAYIKSMKQLRADAAR